MANKFLNTAKKLQIAINGKFPEQRLLLNITQWYSEDKRCTINMYTLKRVIVNEHGKKTTVELFKTYSTIQLTLWLRDYWYTLNGWEVPNDNATWNEMKEKYGKAEDTRRRKEEAAN